MQEFGTPASAGVAQAPVRQATVPSAPTQPALASRESATPQVLGTESQRATVPTHNVSVATTSPAVAAALAQQVSINPPLWSFFVGFPKDTLRYAYYGIAALILLALCAETGLEIHRRHRRHAMKAAALLIAIGVFFVLANILFFATPTIAATGALF